MTECVKCGSESGMGMGIETMETGEIEPLDICRDCLFGKPKFIIDPNPIELMRVPFKMSEWHQVRLFEPPKDRPFLAKDTVKGETYYCIMEWKDGKLDPGCAYLPYNENCGCCTGYCGFEFTEWMEIPK